MDSAMTLSQGARAALTFQTYEPQPPIDGVFVHRLKVFRGLEGDFMELCRLREGQIEGLPQGFEPRQFSLSKAVPGRLNAFHLHPKRPQHELWCVLEGQLRVWLVDLRQGSATEGNRRQVILSGEEPAFLFVPWGVAHGYQAGARGAMLLYASSDTFNFEDPNEGRLPWDHFGAGLWAEDRG
jgi:dTDP-4-dehydrorhamnose 3,5-epimerase